MARDRQVIPTQHKQFERVAVSLSPGERDALRELAASRGEPEATTAARLVRGGLADAGAQLDPPPKRRRGPGSSSARRSLNRHDGPTVGWLPTNARAGAVAQLFERYPHELSSVVTPEPADRAAAERLAALSVWRGQLDAGVHADPRVELMFSDELTGTSQWLRHRRFTRH